MCRRFARYLQYTLATWVNRAFSLLIVFFYSYFTHNRCHIVHDCFLFFLATRSFNPRACTSPPQRTGNWNHDRDQSPEIDRLKKKYQPRWSTEAGFRKAGSSRTWRRGCRQLEWGGARPGIAVLLTRIKGVAPSHYMSIYMYIDSYASCTCYLFSIFFLPFFKSCRGASFYERLGLRGCGRTVWPGTRQGEACPCNHHVRTIVPAAFSQYHLHGNTAKHTHTVYALCNRIGARAEI